MEDKVFDEEELVKAFEALKEYLSIIPEGDLSQAMYAHAVAKIIGTLGDVNVITACPEAHQEIAAIYITANEKMVAIIEKYRLDSSNDDHTVH